MKSPLKLFILNKVGDWRPAALVKLKYFIDLFQGKLTFTLKIYRTASCITATINLIFQRDVSQNSYFWLLLEKSIKCIHENSNLVIASKRSKSLIGNYVSTSNYTVLVTLFTVSLAELYALLINAFEKTHLINSKVNLQPHNIEAGGEGSFFVTIVKVKKL